MSTSDTHQQSLADAGSETRPSMLERGPYEFRIFTPSETEAPRMQKEEGLRGDDLKHYEAEIEAMNLILTLSQITYITLWMLALLQKPCGKEAKKLEKSHDPLALVAHTGFSSRTTTPYYVTNPSVVVDYDDDYQGDVVQNNSEDPLTSAMILLARAITQCFSNPTNNRLRTSSNTRNQTIVQGDRVNMQSKNSRNNGRNIRRSYLHEEIIEGNNVQNDARNIQRTLRTTSLGTTVNVQCYNCSNCPKLRNDFLFADASRMEEIEELSANICLMARIQLTNIDSDAGPSYDSAFLSEVQTLSTSYVNPLFAKDNQDKKYLKQPKIINNTIGDDQIDSNIIFNELNGDVNSGSIVYDNNVQESYALEQLARNAYKEARKQQIIAKKSILKCKMSENEDQYHDIVLDLEVRAKKNEDVVLKMGYTNPYTLIAISQNPKLYDASCLDDSKNPMHVRDTKDILDDATKSQIKMKNKMKDQIAIKKKQNVCIIDYKKLNALYEDFVPQKELSAEQTYFPSSFITFENSSNVSSPYSSSETKPTVRFE
ncbi:hypothetical protein Tco_0360164 [Tanacetum coccineum]